MILRRLALGLTLSLVPMSTLAVQPDEMLTDPAMEARARDISSGLRCLVCRNESIDESNAELARDLRILVRERLEAGDSDREVVDYVVDRYGEYVLLNPRADGSNLLLWYAGPGMLLIALTIAGCYLRRRGIASDRPSEELSPEETARLKAILKK